MQLTAHLLILALHVAAILIFSTGFSTSRISIPRLAVRQNTSENTFSDAKAKPFEKLILVAIDGLRADFAIERQEDIVPPDARRPLMKSFRSGCALTVRDST